MRKIVKKIVISTLIISLISVIAFMLINPQYISIAQENYGNLDEHSYTEMPTINLPNSEYLSYTEFRSTVAETSAEILLINLNTWDKIIRFDSAEELYRFSLDVSYNLKYTPFETKLTEDAISVLLSLDYVLGRDIDYTVMKSKQFNPIGYHFTIEDTTYSQAFTGTFDGNGFEITSLYFSSYDKLIQRLYEGTEFEEEVSYIEYYAMFAYNEGTIQNLGLVNPTYEFNFESPELYKAANLVGENRASGNVNHVYVIDYRSTALVAGIRMVSSAGQASGVLFDNYGTFTDAYFVGRVVVNASYGSRFTVQPVIYENHTGGNIDHLAFDDTLYQETVTVAGSSYQITTPNGLATSMTTVQLRNVNVILGTGWYYYPGETNPIPKYPTTLGLDRVVGTYDVTINSETNETVTLTNYFVIENALDFIAFSKMLNYNRESGQTPFRELDYLITNHIDMSMISPNAYATPTVEFEGVLAGINDDIHISHLHLVDGMVFENYYAGLFGILRGEVYNLIFLESSLTLTETDDYAGVIQHVGFIAGELIDGIIRNVRLDIDINLGEDTLGETYVGLLVGKASGFISGIYTQGLLEGNDNHVYRTDILINPTYKMGGVIGGTGDQSLILTDSYTQAEINGIGTSSTQMNASLHPTIYMGGVIGYVNNQLDQTHVLGLLTSEATLYTNEIISSYSEIQYVGGVIGMSSGLAYPMNEAFGNFNHHGEINVMERGTNVIYASGILHANHSEAVEFIHLFNHDDASFIQYLGGSGNFNNLSYTTLIYNHGQELTLSQSRNEQDLNLVGDIDLSGLYHSTNNSYTLIRFVENLGDIIYENQVMASTTYIAGISLSENIDYLNVRYFGTIRVSNVTMQSNNVTEKELYLSGITTTLSMNRKIVNGLVEGQLIVAGITGNQANYTASNNIYIGGFVNFNRSGDMDPNGNLSMPVATIGILNSLNRADMISRYGVYSGISGHTNTYVGGIATFNDGDIQDTANLGDIRFENTSNVDTNNVTFNTTSTAGGSVTKYRYAIIAGGVTAAVLSYHSRIYDSSNKGTIIALSKNYARAGGILGIAIYIELIYGNVDSDYGSATDARIWDSILSNCINYGTVSALTISISAYSTSAGYETLSSGEGNQMRHDITQDVIVPAYESSYYSRLYIGTRISSSGDVRIYTRESSDERPGINGSSGGVIGYGLVVMRRMVNHGQVSSSDVAGGVVGATVVIGQSQYVQIDTAINYGTVRAFDRGTSANNYANFNSVDVMDYETVRDHFYPVDSDFIFPDTYSDIRLYPEDKRGIGGIFGRLQRGANLIMYGNNDSNSTFNFIVNMDPNVDLIGRLDQVINYYSSLRFYDFEDAVYYSARKNDTTQAIFTGISFFRDSANTGYRNVVRTEYNIQITSQKYEYTYDAGSGQWLRTTYLKTENRTEVELYGGYHYTRSGYSSATYNYYESDIISRSDGPTHGESGWVMQSGTTVPIGTLTEYKYEHDLPLYNQVWDIESTKVITGISQQSSAPSFYLFANTLPIPIITEDEDDPEGQYVYDPSFDMQTDSVLQQYIYYSENGNLSDTFINSRPNGMYVLATSSGSTFGSILPANIHFERLLPLASGPEGELPSYDIDYELASRIDASDDPNYLSLLADYETLFQTKYSDKSDLLEESEDQAYLEEVDGSMTKLFDPTFVHPATQTSNGIITFDLNLATLDFNGGSLATVNYYLRDVVLPNKAVLAKTIEDYYGLPYGSDVSSYINSYQDLLETYADPLVDPESKPDLEPVLSYTFDLNDLDTGIITIGYVTSYSEVSQYYPAFLNDSYVTDYQIRLNVTYDATPTLPYLYSYQIDGGTIRTTIVSNITAEPVDQTLTFNFRDPDGILPIGTDILNLGTLLNDNVELAYFDQVTQNYVLVDQEDYDITSSLVSSAFNHPFSFTLSVNNSLKGGLYRLGFRLLPYQDNKTYYTFTKGYSTESSLLEMEYYSSGVINPSSTNFISYVNFGYAFDFSDLTVTEVSDPLAKAYQSSASSYEIPFLNYIKVSDFATISNITIGDITYQANGFRIYTIYYTVLAENNSTQTIYEQRIYERPIQILDVYRNNNKVVMNALSPVVISREALSTTVSIDYGIDELYASDLYNLIGDNPDSYFAIDPVDVTGIEVSVNDRYLVFTVDALASAGDYAFDITYVRTGDSPIDLGTLYIRKNQGTDAYLDDIQFAELATETIYAPIHVSDSEGVIDPLSPFNPSIYYAGIDYDGADLAMITNFRVDGQVSNIPLDSYIPYFLNYLPLGASIQRKLPDNSYTVGVTGPDDPNVYVLAADFTASEENEGEDIIITYRVISEDGLNHVDYHITVTDITYNVSFLFEVVYEGNALLPDLGDSIIVINVKNINTNLPVGDTLVTEFPAFSTVTGYNNTTNLMYMLDQPMYKFRFGRNKSGYFSFSVDVLEPNGYVFDYKIELNGTDELDDIKDYDPSSNDPGKYYYINSSIQNRSRSFVITIYNASEPTRDYGFTDFDRSW